MERKLFLVQSLIWVMIAMGQIHRYKSCIEIERKGLLELKTYLLLSGDKHLTEPDHAFDTWSNDTRSDCCRWERVKCNRTTRRVIGLALNERYSVKYSLKLSLLYPFEELQSLDLSGNHFTGFSASYVEGYRSLRRLRNLKILVLSSNDFNNSILPFLSFAKALTALILRANYMDGSFPVKELKSLTNLELLDLSRNSFDGSIPVRELAELKKLKVLDLSSNNFSGWGELQEWCWCIQNSNIYEFSNLSKCELKNLQELDLSRNKLIGEFPICLTTLTGLRVLDLSSNQMTGKVPSAIGSIESLEYLSLFDNDFHGFFSLSSLSNLSKLKVFKLYSKSNSLQVESESVQKLEFQLNVIALRFCNLGKLPHFLLHQKELRLVDLSDNRLPGVFPSWLIENNTNLEVLLLQNNSFTSFQLPKSAHNLLFLDVSANEFSQLFPANIGWILPNLRHLNLSKNIFQGNLPSSLGNMKKMYFLDLSQNGFYGKLPRSLTMGCYSLIFLKLSHNKLSGHIFPEPTNLTSLEVLTLDTNQFAGRIGDGLLNSSNMFVLDMSNNYLTGVIPSWIGSLSDNLIILLISKNSLEGRIPASLFNISSPMLLDLSANRLSGDLLPRLNSYTRLLFLQDNNISGMIPDTLEYVQAIFLSTEIQFATKRRYDAYMGGTLSYMFGLDLAENELSGEIPEELGDLVEIRALNLSHNYLSGVIPESFSNMKDLESLDLSFNNLHGQIPSQLTELSSLAVFNVSYNNLSGIIPRNGQFSTFEETSYIGNPLLCGQPSNRSCNNDTLEEAPETVGEDVIDIESFYWSIFAAYVTILLGILASLSFDSAWTRIWFCAVDAFIHKVKILTS